jgi:hypothetical protein
MNKLHLPLLIGVAVWFVVIYWLAEGGAFINGPSQRPVAVGVAFAAPILLFLLGIRTLPGWRTRVTTLSPILLIAMNGWRFIGLGFLMAYSEGLLPGGFAWPAGLGDIFMAATAPWVAAQAAANDRFRFGALFLVWNLLGIADFLDAVLWGTVYSWPGFTSSDTTALMQRLPFALIPCFFVPLVAMAHITLLEQRRRMLGA